MKSSFPLWVVGLLKKKKKQQLGENFIKLYKQKN